ncbi:MAG: LPD23 domain-containing protein, partial [Clostridia bacterium]
MAKLNIAGKIDEIARLQREGKIDGKEYNFYDNIPKTTYLPTSENNFFHDAGKIYENLGTGFIKSGLNITNFLADTVEPYLKTLKNEDINNWMNDFQKNISSTIQSKTNQEQRASNSINNDVMKKASEVSTSIGQMLPTAVTSLSSPVLSAIISLANAGGQSMEEAEQKGANDTQKLLYGSTLGAAEGLTEMIGLGQLSKGAKEVAKGGIRAGIKRFGISTMDNVIQEAIMEPTTEIASQAILGKSDWENMPQRMLQSGVDGALTSAVMGGATAGLSKTVNIANKIENNKSQSNAEVKQTYKTSNNILDTLSEKVSETKNILPDDKTNINRNILAENITNSNIEVKDKQELISKLNDINKIDDILMQDIISEINPSDYKLSAKKYNIDTNNETVKCIDKVTGERGIKTIYNADMFKNNNVNAMWKVDTDENGNITRKVILNPNADTNKTLENITVHELTHDLEGTNEYNTLKQLVQDYDSKKSGYLEARQSLEEAYSQVYDKESIGFEELVDNEAVADILGSKLGDQEFINNLTIKDQTISQKVYNWVIDKLNKINKLTGYKSEKLYWSDVKNKFETSFKQDYANINNNQNKFSIQVDSNGNKYVKVDTDQDIFEGKTAREFTNIARKYILKNYRDGNKPLLLPTAEKINVTSKTASEYTHPKTELQNPDKKMKMKASTELDNLLNISDYQYSVKDDGRHSFAKDGWDYYKTVFEVNGFKYEGLINIAKHGDTKTLYDITQIKKMPFYNTSDKSFIASPRTSSLYNNSITPINTDVNTTDKYSMQNNTKYSIAGKKAMENLNDSKLEKQYENAQHMKSIGVNNETIRQSTNWFQDKNGDWKFEFSDKDMELKKDIKLEKNKTYKLGDILEHDTLFSAYPELANYKVHMTENSKINGSYNKFTDLIKLDVSKLNTQSKSEGTLIHEIQHAIQKIEGYEGGASNKASKLRYYESLGEIEATDTKDRFILEKYKNQNLTNTPPETSKYNPEHKNLQKYLNNRNIFDKIKDKRYNYKKDGVNYENVETNILENTKNNGREILQKNTKIRGQAWNRLGSEGRGHVELEKSNSISLPNTVWDNRLNTLYKNENVGNKIKDLKKEVNTAKTLSKNQRYEKSKTNQFITNLTDKLQVSKYSNKELLNNTVNEIKEEIRNNGTLSDESKTKLFNKLYNDLKIVDKTYYNEYKDLFNDLKTTKVYLPTNIKSDVDNIKIRTTSDMNATKIDVKYQELSEVYPGLFSSKIDNEADQLIRMSKVKEDILLSERNLNEYNDIVMGPEYKKFAKNDFDNLVYELENDVKLADRYKEAKTEKEKKKIEEVEDVKEVFKMANEYQKQHDKVMAKEVLTDVDNKYLKALENGSLTVEELKNKKDKPNVKGILNVYEVSKPLRETQKAIEKFRKDVKAEHYDKVKDLTENMNEWKDKKGLFAGFRLNRETFTRNIQDVVKDKKTADKINSVLYDKYSSNEAESTRIKNEIGNRIRDLGLDTKEKYVYDGNKINEYDIAQLYLEKKLDDGQVIDYGVNLNKIKEASNTYKEIFDDLCNKMSDTLVANGYAPVEYRKNYFPHFTENKPDTFLGKISSMVGIDTTYQELDTSIAGTTASRKPGKTWMGNLLQRTSDVTDYNALKSIDMYLQGSMDIIYHTDDIQRLRAFESTIRDSYLSEEMKKRIEEIKDNENISPEDKVEAIEKIHQTANNQLSHFVTWIREYTNVLAGKKSSADRQFEYELGRNIYITAQNLESRFAANAVGGNLSVSLTNIAPLIQATGTTGYGNVLKGMLKTMTSSISHDDSFINNSDFLTKRRGTDKLYKTTVNKLSEIASKPFQIIDDFVSESIVRAKYDENISNGMSEIDALTNADKYTANLMADRSKGALPVTFNSKNPIAKVINMFQVEVNNTLSNYTKDMKIDAKTKTQLVQNYTKLFAGTFVFNTLIKSIRGGNDVLPDPIHWVMDVINYLFGDDEEKEKSMQSLGNNIVGAIPFSNIAGLVGMEDIGRLPT